MGYHVNWFTPIVLLNCCNCFLKTLNLTYFHESGQYAFFSTQLDSYEPVTACMSGCYKHNNKQMHLHLATVKQWQCSNKFLGCKVWFSMLFPENDTVWQYWRGWEEIKCWHHLNMSRDVSSMLNTWAMHTVQICLEMWAACSIHEQCTMQIKKDVHVIFTTKERTTAWLLYFI